MARLQHAAATFPPGGEGELRRFYGELLGLPEMPLPADVPPEMGWIWFDTDDEGVELHFIPDERPPDPERRHHMCLELADLAPAVARLEAAGFAPRPPRTPIGGRERLFVRDPFGNLVELLAVTA